MNKKVREKIDTLIYKAIQNELSYQTDYIANDGWAFLEDKAKELIYEKIKEDYDEDEIEELEELELRHIESYLADVIYDYEENNPPIRVHSLWK